MELVISDYSWDFVNMGTCDLDLQSVVDKMVREISLEVWEKSGICFQIFGGNPVWVLIGRPYPVRPPDL